MALIFAIFRKFNFWTRISTISALDAHTSMSKQALDSEDVREGMKGILLQHAGLWEGLRSRAGAQ